MTVKQRTVPQQYADKHKLGPRLALLLDLLASRDLASPAPSPLTERIRTTIHSSNRAFADGLHPCVIKVTRALQHQKIGSTSKLSVPVDPEDALTCIQVHPHEFAHIIRALELFNSSDLKALVDLDKLAILARYVVASEYYYRGLNYDITLSSSYLTVRS